jgi:hypothetical protein
MTAAADLRDIPSGKSRGEIFAGGFGFTGLFAAVMLGVPSRRKWAALFGVALLAIALNGIGCGGGGSSHTVVPSGPKTYIVTVTGTGTTGGGTALTRSTDVSLTVH